MKYRILEYEDDYCLEDQRYYYVRFSSLLAATDQAIAVYEKEKAAVGTSYYVLITNDDATEIFGVVCKDGVLGGKQKDKWLEFNDIYSV